MIVLKAIFKSFVIKLPSKLFLVLNDVMAVSHRLAKLLANFAISWPIVRDDSCARKNVTSNQRVQGSFFCGPEHEKRT